MSEKMTTWCKINTQKYFKVQKEVLKMYSSTSHISSFWRYCNQNSPCTKVFIATCGDAYYQYNFQLLFLLLVLIYTSIFLTFILFYPIVFSISQSQGNILYFLLVIEMKLSYWVHVTMCVYVRDLMVYKAVIGDWITARQLIHLFMNISTVIFKNYSIRIIYTQNIAFQREIDFNMGIFKKNHFS